MAKLKLNQQIFDLIYPVGSVYLTVNDINPQTLFGGTWVKSSGGFIYGSTGTGTKGENGNGTGTNTVASTGSTGTPSTNTSGSTTLTASQSGLPKHNHPGIRWGTTDGTPFVYTGTGGNDGIFDLAGSGIFRDNYSYGGTYHIVTENVSAQNASSGHTHTLGNHTHSLNSHAHDIPYISCYIWKRTA